jgi:hypothetical protein
VTALRSIGMIQLIFGALFLFVLWQIVRAALRGAWHAGEAVYDRREQPVEYWFNLLFSIAMLPLVGWLVLVGDDYKSSLAWRLVFPVAFGIPATFWLIRALQTGTIGPAGMTADRVDEPRRFWLRILGLVALIALGGAIAIWHEEPRPRTFYDEVGPVLAAVRAQLPGPAAAEFYDVRVDSATRLICGQVKRPDGKMLRFFGTGDDRGAEATLESDALPDFGDSYARLCGGEPIRP